jgi:uncharacterized membrane protein
MAYNSRVMIESGWQWIIPDKDLLFAILYTMVTLVTVYLPIFSETYVRLAFGLGMVLFIPGYALVAALFPGRKEIDGLERVALSFGLSIAVAPLIGLALNFTPWGLRLDPILVCLTMLTLLCLAIARLRRLGLRPEDRYDIEFGKKFKKSKARVFPADVSRLDRVLTVILLLSVLASIATLAYVVSMPRQGEKFTEFYILGPDGRADDLPAGTYLGEQVQVIAGVVNHEYRDVPYDLVVRLNDSGNISQLLAEHLMLPDNRTWEKMLNITLDRPGRSMKLEFLLYADGDMTVTYRDLHLWINVTDGDPGPLTPARPV